MKLNRKKTLPLLAVLVLLAALSVFVWVRIKRSPAQAARDASNQFVTENAMPSTLTDAASEEERQAVLALCREHGITLTDEETERCDSYYETILPMLDEAGNAETKENFMQIVKNSGLSLQEYERVSEESMKYLLLREKLLQTVYSGDEAALAQAICAKK